MSKCRHYKKESRICGEGGMHYALRALLAAQAPWSCVESSTALNIPLRFEPSVQLPVHMISSHAPSAALGLPPLAQSSAPRGASIVRSLMKSPPAAARSPPKLYSYASQLVELERWRPSRHCCATYSVQQGETRCCGLGRIRLFTTISTMLGRDWRPGVAPHASTVFAC